jgi:hypothetical protein
MKLDPKTLATKDEVTAAVDTATKRIDLLLTGVIIVMLIGFAALLVAVAAPIIDAWRFKATTYESLRDKVESQNVKIDALSEKFQNCNVKKSSGC